MTEQNPSYLEAILESGKYQDNPQGYISYKAASKTNQNLVSQLNFLISFIGELHKKIDKINNRLDSLEKQKSIIEPSKKDELDEIINKFEKITIDRGKGWINKSSKRPYRGIDTILEEADTESEDNIDEEGDFYDDDDDLFNGLDEIGFQNLENAMEG